MSIWSPSSLSILTNKELFSTQLPPNMFFLFLGPFSVNPRNGCDVIKIQVDQQFVKYTQ